MEMGWFYSYLSFQVRLYAYYVTFYDFVFLLRIKLLEQIHLDVESRLKTMSFDVNERVFTYKI